MLSFRKIFTHAALSLLLTGPILANAKEEPKPPPAEAATAAVVLDEITLQGTVTETMNSSGYTYLQLDTAQGKIWVAIPETEIKVGQAVTCAPGMTMKNFASKTLNRTFETIIFSPGLDQGKTTLPQPVPATPAKGKESTGFGEALQAEKTGKAASGTRADSTALGASTGSAGAIVVPSTDINVHKAPGPNSYSVGECYEQAKDLNSKTIKVRGKVMKISRMIMGKNWLHIQDGTGNPLKNQHDLVVTTQDDPGDNVIVTVEGILTANRDFGAGYKYDAIIEDAKVEK
jgi:hypothetical protein